MNPKPRFAIGLAFKVIIRGSAVSYPKHIVRQCTIADIYKTYNSAGELVKVRYVVTHEFNGQTVTDYDVVDTTIAKALWAEHGKLPTTDDWGNP